MQDIRNLIDVIENNVNPKWVMHLILNLERTKQLFATVVEQVVDDAVVITADEKALKLEEDSEEACGCEMPQEEPVEKDLEREALNGQIQNDHE